MSLVDVVDLLVCPSCVARGVHGASLLLDEPARSVLRCQWGHAFDVARQGHVNLLGRAAPRNADTPAMVAARERFLGSGAYDRVGDALVAAALPGTAGPATVLDLGSGPGWYLDRVLAGLDAEARAGRGLAVDVSPAAARRAARSPWAVGAVVADAWAGLPVQDGSVDVVLSVFAPRHASELARVLRPGGTAVVVSPLPDHLAGLRQAWGLLDVEAGKQERLATTFREHLRPVQDVDVRYTATVDASRVADLVAMGPNAFHRREPHRSPAETPTELGVAVRVSTWRRDADRAAGRTRA